MSYPMDHDPVTGITDHARFRASTMADGIAMVLKTEHPTDAVAIAREVAAILVRNADVMHEKNERFGTPDRDQWRTMQDRAKVELVIDALPLGGYPKCRYTPRPVTADGKPDTREERASNAPEMFMCENCGATRPLSKPHHAPTVAGVTHYYCDHQCHENAQVVAQLNPVRDDVTVVGRIGTATGHQLRAAERLGKGIGQAVRLAMRDMAFLYCPQCHQRHARHKDLDTVYCSDVCRDRYVASMDPTTKEQLVRMFGNDFDNVAFGGRRAAKE